MHWTKPNVNSMLAIRNILCSDRWKEKWEKIALHLRPNHSQIPIQPEPVSPPVECPALPIPNQFKIVQNKKTIENPWRRFKVGRSLYHPENFPKN